MKSSNPYTVVRSPYQPKRWAILDTRTNEVVEAGFFSKPAAQEYIWREYDAR